MCVNTCPVLVKVEAVADAAVARPMARQYFWVPVETLPEAGGQQAAHLLALEQQPLALVPCNQQA